MYVLALDVCMYLLVNLYTIIHYVNSYKTYMMTVLGLHV